MAKYYIDRDALVEWLKRIPLKDLSDGLGLCRVIMEDDFKKAIKKMPKGIIADVAPVVHAHWTGSNGTYCSHCERSYMDVADADSWESSDIPDFCPYCGAQMDEKEE